MKYSAPYISASHDVINLFAHFIIVVINPYFTLHIKEYPVFVPNEYFWANHWVEGKEE